MDVNRYIYTLFICNIMNSKIFQFIFAAVITSGFVACVDNDEEIAQNYYTSTKSTAAQFIEQNSERVGLFTKMLKKTPYFNLLSAYGHYTVFVPSDSAVNVFIKKRGFDSVDSIPEDICDSWTRNHIIDGGAFFTTDIGEGTLPMMNMADTYVNYTLANDTENGNSVQYYVNYNSRMLEYDDSVSNGVVHLVDRFLERADTLLPAVIAKDPNLTIFAEALELTGLSEALGVYEDEAYHNAWASASDITDSCYKSKMVLCKTNEGGVAPCTWPEHRYFKFTVFAETDEVFKSKGINDINDLITWANNNVYLPNGVNPSDTRDPKNALNRFVSYHILECSLPYDQVIMDGAHIKECWNVDLSDPEEFYETMSGDLMRFCLPNGEGSLYINRKGLKDTCVVEGVKVLNPAQSSVGETTAKKLEGRNGLYYYLDNILAFTQETHDEVLNCRIRMDGGVLSPDFQNSGARGRWGANPDALIGLRPGFIKNIDIKGKGVGLAMHNDHPNWNSYKQNAVNITGIFDIEFKLPRVPSGTYEIRTGYSCGVERGVVQFYLNNVPCGIPADLREYGNETVNGWKADIIKDNGKPDKEANKAIDKAMRNHEHMKAMDSYHTPNASDSFRDHSWNLRRILTTTRLDENETYYLRCRQVLEDGTCFWNFDYLEIVPKDVWGSPEGEDTH